MEELKSKVPASFDARDWAEEFNLVLARKGEQPYDPVWLVGWFANALMRGFDEGRKGYTEATPTDEHKEEIYRHHKDHEIHEGNCVTCYLRAAPTVSEEDIMGALARGYCYKENKEKVLDSTLIESMTKEILALQLPRTEVGERKRREYWMDSKAYCWFCKKDIDCECMDATCWVCHRPYAQDRCKEFGYDNDGKKL